MARLEQRLEKELPFIILRLLPKDKTGIRWNELWERCSEHAQMAKPEDARICSTGTLSKYLTELQGNGCVRRFVDERRMRAPVVFAITERGLAKLAMHEAGPMKDLIPIWKEETQIDTDPVGLKDHLDKTGRNLRGTLISRKIKFFSIPAKPTAAIYVDKGTAKDATWHISPKMKELPELVVNSILQARYRQISGGKTTSSFQEQFEWITEALNFEAALIVDFDGRSVVRGFNVKKAVRDSERLRKMHDSSLASFRGELLNPTKRRAAAESFVANRLELMTEEFVGVTAKDLIREVVGCWKEGELPKPLEAIEIRKMLDQWEQDGIITTTDGEIEATEKIRQKHPERAEDVTVAIAHMNIDPPPWGKAKPET
jgi:DNA-binding PadR family transcriptional regulator